MSPKTIKLNSVIKCPICKFQKELIMPSGSFLLLYECEECNARLKPKAHDCCVFCSYGSVPCPTAQKKMKSS